MLRRRAGHRLARTALLLPVRLQALHLALHHLHLLPQHLHVTLRMSSVCIAYSNTCRRRHSYFKQRTTDIAIER